jgi:hypothetical protein
LKTKAHKDKYISEIDEEDNQTILSKIDALFLELEKK